MSTISTEEYIKEEGTIKIFYYSKTKTDDPDHNVNQEWKNFKNNLEHYFMDSLTIKTPYKRFRVTGSENLEVF